MFLDLIACTIAGIQAPSHRTAPAESRAFSMKQVANWCHSKASDMEIISGVYVNQWSKDPRPLIGSDPSAFVRIDPGMAGNASYRINERRLVGLRDFWKGDWQDLRFSDLERVAYSGAEHSVHPKQTNITVLADWSADRHGVSVTV